MSSDLDIKQLRSIFSDNMKKASARAKELHAMTGLAKWHIMSQSLAGLRMRGLEISNAKSLSKSETNVGLDRYKGTLGDG